MFKLALYLFALCVCINSIVADDKKEETAAVDSGDKKDASTRKCYVCNENTDDGCADPFNTEKYLKTCDADEQYCRKTVQFGKIKVFFFIVLLF
jgi:hypothetical protein